MSGGGPDQRAGYSLIPQSNSDDSDLSEEELHSLYQDGFQIITKKHVYPPVTAKRNTKGTNSKMQTFATAINSEKPNEPDQPFSSFQKDTSIAGELNRMTSERKVLFSLSIFLCFLVIGLFLSLPCAWENCSYNLQKNGTGEVWRKAVLNVEFKGPFTFVYTKDEKHLNFILMARGSVFADAPVLRTNFTSSSGGDVFAFNGLSGHQLWRKHFNKMPHDLDCDIFPVNNKSSKNCIIVNYWNYVTVLLSEKGKTLWNTPLTTKLNRTNENFPIMVPDLDEDGFPDILLNKDINKLTVLSGQTGIALPVNDLKLISNNCSEIKNVKIYNSSVLQFDCSGKDIVAKEIISLKDYIKPSSILSGIRQHWSFESTNQLAVHNYIIHVANEGDVCPGACKTNITIHNSEANNVWFHYSNNSFAMTPVIFDLNSSLGVYGFICKIWKHEEKDTELNKRKIPHDNWRMTVSLVFEHLIIVVFNSTKEKPLKIINVNKNPILQLYDAQKSIQPDPFVQQYSLAVADVGKNGSRQIITYYSTFEDDKKNSYTFTDFTLKSYIQMYDLEKEIIKGLN